MTVHQRTGLWILLGAVAAAFAFTWLVQDVRRQEELDVPWDGPLVERDLEAIRKDTLRVLVIQDPLSWEARPGAESGFEFELLERFARSMKVPMKVVVMTARDTMYMALQRGIGDVIAAQHAPVRWESKWFAHSEPFMLVRPMLARVRSEARSADPSRTMDTVIVSEFSPFRSGPGERALMEGARSSPATPEDLLMGVVVGTVPACVVTDATAAHEATRLPALEFVPVEGKERPLCFAIRTNAPALRNALDAWIKAPEEKRFRNALLDGYLGRLSKPGALKKRSMPAAADSISPYDSEFRKHGQGFGWKWQLLTAMAWKESRFDSTAVSDMGAQGIMQFMPNTAARYGLDSAMSVGDHIQAAKHYIMRLDTLWMRAVPDRDARLRFVLASYNAGVGHIIDAQRLAERLGLDPEQWEGHVERAVLLLAKPRYYTRSEMKNGYCKGSQVFHYVRDIVALYEQLVGLPKRKPEPTPDVIAPAVEPTASSTMPAAAEEAP
ncbi:MAG: transglycosylase SLT domain-containing protein [Flavobacteriales bacterium]